MSQNDMAMQALAQVLAPLLQPTLKHTIPSGTPSTPYYTGPGGLFGISGLERELISTRVQPRGLIGKLPFYPSVTMNPLFPYLTGFTADTGSEKSGVCDPPPVAGPGKSCIQTAQFGRYERKTREMEVNRIGQRIDRGEFDDLTLINDPFAEELGGVLAQRFALSRQSARMLGSEMLMRFVEVGVSVQNLICPQVFIGNPANNTAGGGYKEFPGLDILIGTNKFDALTNTECPSLDSDVKDFNYELVTNVDLNPNIVEVLTYMMRYLKHNASTMNFDPVTWAFVMRDDLFYELTSVWACSYMTYRCWVKDTTHIDAVPSYDAAEGVRFRDDMRNGNYLLVDGMRIPVIIDDCIPEESSGDNGKIGIGCYASDIYIVPMTILGGRPATFMQYYDYSQGTLPAIQQGNYQAFYWTDGGRFLWHETPPVIWCIQHVLKIEPRLILQTPHLAGRLTNVEYCPLQHTRDPLPSQDYFVDGGVSTPRAAPSLYSDWNPPRQ